MLGMKELLERQPDSVFSRATRHYEKHGSLPPDLPASLLAEMRDGMPPDAPPEFKRLVNADCSTT